MGAQEGVLRDVLRILAVAQDAEGDPEGQRGRVGDPLLELALERRVQAHRNPADRNRVIQEHLGASDSQTPRPRSRFTVSSERELAVAGRRWQ